MATSSPTTTTKKPVQAIPRGYHSLTPYLIVKGGAKALDYYAKAFSAKEIFRMPGPDGCIGHAEMTIGDSHFMIADEFPTMGFVGPETLGGSTVSLMIYTEDCDALFKQAIAAGGTVVREVQDQFYGDRSGTLKDPFGHMWTISTHVEDVDPDELARRSKEMMERFAQTGECEGA